MSTASQLSSMATSLAELTERLAHLAESLSGTEEDAVAAGLYEVERSLSTASRRLDQVVNELSS